MNPVVFDMSPAERHLEDSRGSIQALSTVIFTRIEPSALAHPLENPFVTFQSEASDSVGVVGSAHVILARTRPQAFYELFI